MKLKLAVRIITEPEIMVVTNLIHELSIRPRMNGCHQRLRIQGQGLSVKENIYRYQSTACLGICSELSVLFSLLDL